MENISKNKNKNSIIKILVLALIVIGTISLTAIITFADKNNDNTRVELYETQLEDNETFNVSNMLPGDRISQQYNVRLYHNQDVTLYFKANITDEIKNLGNVLKIRVTDTSTGDAVCEDTFDNINGIEYSQMVLKGSSNVTDKRYDVDVWLETSVGNDYENASLKADFIWYVKGDDDGGASEDKDSGLVPKTGDRINQLLWALFIGSMAILMIILILNRNKIKEKRLDKSLYKSLFSITILVCMLAVTTYALIISSAEVRDNLFITGDVSINLNDGEPIFPEDEDTMALNIEPGHTLQRTFFIENTGTADAYYRLYIVPIEGSDVDMLNLLEFKLIDDGNVVYSGTISEFSKATPYISEKTLKISERHNYTVQVKMPEIAGNEYQNNKILFTMAADATQVKNNDGKEFE